MSTSHFTSYSHLKLCHANVIIVIKVLEKFAKSWKKNLFATHAGCLVTYKCIKQRLLFVAFWLFAGLTPPHHVNTINSIAKYIAVAFSLEKKALEGGRALILRNSVTVCTINRYKKKVHKNWITLFAQASVTRDLHYAEETSAFFSSSVARIIDTQPNVNVAWT